MNWSETAWSTGNKVYEQIISMPFNRELAEGTLEPEKFKFYIAQDSIYLAEFGKALALIAARAHSTDHMLEFIRFAEGAVVVEKALHAGYFKQFGVAEGITASPSCQLYTQYLLNTAALGQVEVAMAAVLPCFWIYKKVGDHIYRHQTKKDNPYQDWINTYAGEEFGSIVERAIKICNEVAVNCSPSQQEAMTQAYLMAGKLEWMFWDSAYRLEKWPV